MNTAQDGAISSLQSRDATQNAAIQNVRDQISSGLGLVIKDSFGQILEKVIGIGLNSSGLSTADVFRRIGNTPLRFQVSAVSFQPLNDSFSFYYTTNNCTGTRHIVSETEQFFMLTERLIVSPDGQTGYFVDLPSQQLILQSFEAFQNGEDPAGVGVCNSGFPPQPLMVGTVSTITLLQGPFHLE